MVYAWSSPLFSPTSRGGNAIPEKSGLPARVTETESPKFMRGETDMGKWSDGVME
jgi:hypothetical protein